MKYILGSLILTLAFTKASYAELKLAESPCRAGTKNPIEQAAVDRATDPVVIIGGWGLDCSPPKTFHHFESLVPELQWQKPSTFVEGPCTSVEWSNDPYSEEADNLCNGFSDWLKQQDLVGGLIENMIGVCKSELLKKANSYDCEYKSCRPYTVRCDRYISEPSCSAQEIPEIRFYDQPQLIFLKRWDPGFGRMHCQYECKVGEWNPNLLAIVTGTIDVGCAACN